MTSIVYALKTACIASMMVGCASVESGNAATAEVGKVLETSEASADTPNSTGIYRPGMGGAGGGLLAGLLSGIGRDPSHTIYVVQIQSGEKRYARSKQQFAVGTCVAILTAASKASQSSWLYGEATISPSSRCPA